MINRFLNDPEEEESNGEVVGGVVNAVDRLRCQMVGLGGIERDVRSEEEELLLHLD